MFSLCLNRRDNRLFTRVHVSANVKPVVEVQQPVQGINSKPLAPDGNPSRLVNARLFCDPMDDFLVACTYRDELFEFGRINPCKVEDGSHRAKKRELPSRSTRP